MNIETLRKNISKRILREENQSTLEKVMHLLDNVEVVGYEVDGAPILKDDFISEIDQTLQELENGTLETLTSAELKRKILG